MLRFSHEFVNLQNDERHKMNDELRLLKIEDVKELLRIGTTYLYELVKQGKLPRPVKQGRSSFWKYQDIKKYIDNLV